MRILLVGLIAGFSLAAVAQDGGVAAKIENAMASDVRTEADVARDRNRKPVATLEFFRLKDDMRVIELVPGGGWYTKLLAACSSRSLWLSQVPTASQYSGWVSMSAGRCLNHARN